MMVATVFRVIMVNTRFIKTIMVISRVIRVLW
jgi:hypothetical protein